MVGTEPQLRWIINDIYTNGGNSYNVKLTADITMQQTDEPAFNMLGNDANAFMGEFDGQGHRITFNINGEGSKRSDLALFYKTSNANIHDLYVSGKITSSGSNTSGLVGNAVTSNTIKNVVSDMTLEQTGTGTATGLAKITSGANVIRNSAFVGKFSCGDDVTCYGLLLNTYDSPVQANDSISDSYVALDKASSFSASGYKVVSNAAALTQAVAPTITNCYNVGDKAEAAETVTALAQNTLADGELCFKLNAETNATKPWRQSIGMEAYPVPSASDKDIVYYNESGSVYTNVNLTVPQQQDGYYIINNEAEMRGFINLVNTTDGKHNARLAADIELAETDSPAYNMIGSDEHPFNGEFDGQGHTITANIIDANGKFNYVGIFHNVLCDNDTPGSIHDLRVSGKVQAGEAKCASGLIGKADIEENPEKVVDFNVYRVISDMTVKSPYSQIGLLQTRGQSYVKMENSAFCGEFDNNGGTTWGLDDDNSTIQPIVSHCYLATKSKCTYYSKYAVTNCYYIGSKWTSTLSGVTKLSDSAIASGELCFKLNNSASNTDKPWRQKIGTDDAPYLWGDDANKVYGCCNVYVNDELTMSEPAEQGGYRMIGTEAEMRWFINDVYVNGGKKHAKLTADITMTQTKEPIFNMIGSAEHPFDGEFNGQGHTITDTIYATKNHSNNLALFYYIQCDNSNPGSIHDLHVSGLVHGYNDDVASLVGSTVCSSNPTSYNFEIYKVVSDMTLDYSSNYNAGLAIIQNYAYIKMDQCAFFGKFVNNDCTRCGLINSYSNKSPYVFNCYVAADNTSNMWFSNGELCDCYYVQGDNISQSGVECLPMSALTSGELCYYMNAACSNKPWRQKIGTDTYPLPWGDDANIVSGFTSSIQSGYFNGSTLDSLKMSDKDLLQSKSSFKAKHATMYFTVKGGCRLIWFPFAVDMSKTNGKFLQVTGYEAGSPHRSMIFKDYTTIHGTTNTLPKETPVLFIPEVSEDRQPEDTVFTVQSSGDVTVSTSYTAKASAKPVSWTMSGECNKEDSWNVSYASNRKFYVSQQKVGDGDEAKYYSFLFPVTDSNVFLNNYDCCLESDRTDEIYNLVYQYDSGAKKVLVLNGMDFDDIITGVSDVDANVLLNGTVRKYVKDGQVVIERDGNLYNLSGKMIK